ncbi:MAG: ester cyclase [Anaerolineaceae bacterium]
MSIESTREIMIRYFKSEHDDVSMLADDVVFTLMSTGQEYHGHDEVLGMMNYLYHVAFDANAKTRITIFDENHALLEANFIGKHIGEFNSIPATGKNVNVPLCVVYDLENNKIKRARIYFETPALLQQLGVNIG